VLSRRAVAPVVAFVVGGWHVEVSSHGLFVALAAVGAVALSVARAPRPSLLLAWAPALVTAALGGADLLYRALHHGTGGGLSSMGGVAAVVAVVLVASRAPRRAARELADAVAPSGIAALGIGRIGCFLAGCCWGRATALPWGVVFPELGPPARHPLQLYSAAFDGLLAAVLWRTSGPPGTTAARAAIGLGLGRLALETLRDPAAADPPIGGVDTATAGALLLALGGMVAAARLRRAGPRR
jgi:prolipoprotein diacylglyceryltransferase